MSKYVNDDAETAMTIVADDNIKNLLKTGTPEEIQDFVQSGQAVSGMSAACFSWTPGLIIGKYEIIRKLGKGGMGVIYLARHTQLDTLRALKVLPAGEADEKKDFAERFIREARIASQIRHPNVVEVMDVETDPELHVSYIVMEYVDGGSLRQTLRKQDRLNLEQAIVTIQGVVSALCAAAEHGIVHRDIKPDNIMFTKRGEVKLADLGIAKKDDEDDNLTKTNVMMGTPAYLSPEQVENPKTVDIRSDIYSLGATFYEMLTGQPPYPGNSAYDILRKIFSEPVPNPRNILPEIPEEIALIVMKMLAKDPQKRYQTPEQLRDALAKIIPALSDTNMQGIVRGIIAGTGEFKTENSGSQSVISATLHELRKRERHRVFMYWGVCAALLIGIIAAWQMLWSKSADRDVTETVTQQSKEEAVSRESVPVLHSLRIRTVAGAALRLTAPDGQIWAYPGNAAGAFHIENLAAGRYRIELSHPEYLAYETICSVPEDDALELPLRPDVKKLTVTGVTGTRIVLHCPDGKKRTFAITDSGKVQIPDLKKGNYVLYASHEKYFSVERSLTVEKDMAIVLELEKRLLNFTLTTHPGSRVELRQNARAMWAKNADAAGFCSFAAIPRGVYEVRISAPQYETHLSTVQVEKDIVAAIPLVKQLYSVAVRGVMGVKVVISMAGKRLRELEIPASGFAAAAGLTPGEYTVDFSREGYWPQRQHIRLKENISLQVSLERLPGKKRTAATAPAPEGVLNIYLSASRDMLDFIRKNGVEIQLNNGDWSAVKSFPFTRKVRGGETVVRVRGKGVMPQDGKMVPVPAGKSTDFLLEIKPKPVVVQLTANRPGVLITVDDRQFRSGGEVVIDPFREYIIRAKFGGKTQEKTVESLHPGETLPVEFVFIEKVHPMQKRYEEGMLLFKEEKYEEALETLLPAAKAGHLAAILQTAAIYEQGLGMWFSDSGEAYKWYWRAAELGHAISARRTAEAIHGGKISGTAVQMLKFYLTAAQNSDAAILYKVAQLYKAGYQDLAADDGKSLQYLQRAAALESPEAMYDLGIRYEKGQGVPFNSKTALRWIRQAAGKGHEKAQRYLEQIKQ